MQYRVSIMKISWHIKILQSSFLWLHPQIKAGNKSWQHRTVTSHPILMNSWKTFPISPADFFFFLTFRKTVYFISTQRIQHNQLAFYSHYISYFCVKFLSTCFFSQNPSINVFVCRRRQLKESVYGDKLPQYNTGGGNTDTYSSDKYHIPSYTFIYTILLT